MWTWKVRYHADLIYYYYTLHWSVVRTWVWVKVTIKWSELIWFCIHFMENQLNDLTGNSFRPYCMDIYYISLKCHTNIYTVNGPTMTHVITILYDILIRIAQYSWYAFIGSLFELLVIYQSKRQATSISIIHEWWTYTRYVSSSPIRVGAIDSRNKIYHEVWCLR